MMTCDQHDYIEIACTFRLPVRLSLAGGERVDGVALDTLYNREREECLRLRTEAGEREVPLASVMVMTAITDNPHFSEVRFG